MFSEGSSPIPARQGREIVKKTSLFLAQRQRIECSPAKRFPHAARLKRFELGNLSHHCRDPHLREFPDDLRLNLWRRCPEFLRVRVGNLSNYSNLQQSRPVCTEISPNSRDFVTGPDTQML